MASKRRGVALFIVLILTLVLFTLLKALTYFATSQVFQSRGYCDRVAALCLVEAGIADALSELESDMEWVEGFREKRLSHMDGTYSVEFNTSGTSFKSTDSVNNLTGSAAVPGFRGPNSVPAGSAEIVVFARAGLDTRTVRVMVSGTGGGGTNQFVMAGNGRIRMRGDISLEGVTSLQEGAPIEASVQSNQSGSDSDIITWEANQPGDRISVSGELRTVGSSSAAVNLGPDPGAYSVGGIRLNANSVPVEFVDVSARVALNAGSPAPAINTSGQSTVSGGTFHHSGDLTINGDLNLEEAELYIAGNLIVNGTIRGKGTLFVDGDTSFKGDSSMVTSNLTGVALFSQENVSLTGYDGTAYMEAVVAGHAEAAQWWQDMTQSQAGVEALVTPVLQMPPAEAADALNALFRDRNFERMIEVLGLDPDPEVATNPNATGNLQAFLSSQPESSSRDFMIDRLEYIQRMYSDSEDYVFNPSGTSPRAVLDDWENGGSNLYGWLDAAKELRDTDYGLKLIEQAGHIDYNRLGSSYFQGTVYTNGYFYSANEVTIVGALLSGGTPEGFPQTVGDYDDVYAGDILLDNRTSLTLTQDYSPLSTSSAGRTHKVSWVEP